MRRQTIYQSSSRRAGLSLFSMLIIIAVLGVAAYFVMKDLSGPEISYSPANTDRMGLSQNFELFISDKSGVQSVSVNVYRGQEKTKILEQEYPTLENDRKITFNLKETNFPEGEFDLEIKATDGSYATFGMGNTTTIKKHMLLDTKPPRISVKTSTPSITRGGSALITYTVSEETSKTGITAGNYFFPGYKQANGTYICLFAYPLSMDSAGYQPEIIAVDLAGNTTTGRLFVHKTNRSYRADTLNIPESFLNFKANELAELCPEKNTSLEQYLCANNKVRESNDATLLAFAADPKNVTDRFLWSGTFKRLPRSATKANFGDARTYVDGAKQKIDHQTHMGVDLASIAHAEIPAAQNGRVVWAEYLGIHGNMVLIDHGLGLMTQYSHMSEFSVRVGDTVQAGDIIGKTGVSGLAGGDHLHFGVLVGGVPVLPLEWLDAGWVRKNISGRMDTL